MEAMVERPAAEARYLAREIPPEARIIALLHDAPSTARDARAADSISAAVGRRRDHTLLTSAEQETAWLDELLGGVAEPGLEAALEGSVRLSDIAVRRDDRPFVYLPAGSEPPTQLMDLDAFHGFVRRVREKGGTLLVYTPATALENARTALLFDGYLTLGSVPRLPDATTGLIAFGRVVYDGGLEPGSEAEADQPSDPALEVENGEGESDMALAHAEAGVPAEADAEILEPGGDITPAVSEEAVDATEEEREQDEPESGLAETGSGKWRRHRAPTGFPWRRAGGGAAIVLVLLTVWILVARGALGVPGAGEASATPARTDENAGDTEAPANVDGEADLSAGAPIEMLPPSRPAPELTAIADAAPELPFSVLIASFAARTDAEDRLNALRPSSNELFFIAPTPVRGSLYHRVFAGAHTLRSDAAATMERLVSDGRKDAASAWDVRPVRFSYRLGIYGSAAEVARALARAGAGGVPAFVVKAAADGESLFMLYAGAYESETAAQPMAGLLAAAGLRAELVSRRGTPR